MDSELTRWHRQNLAVTVQFQRREIEQQVERECEEHRRLVAARERVERDVREEAHWRTRFERGDVEAGRSLLERTARKHGVTFTYSDASPSAHVKRRHVTTTPPTTGEALAVAARESAHCINGSCPDDAPHLDVVRSDLVSGKPTSRSCLQCEVDAWETALTLIPFSTEMMERASRALQTYMTSPATAAAQAAARRFISGALWREERQRRMNRERRQEQIKDIHKWVQEARR